MKKLIAAALITAFASAPAFAADTSFKTSMSYDATAPIDVTYAKFKSQAASICKAQIQQAGYRSTDSTGWQQRKCERQIIASAVKAAKNDQLAAYHNRGGKFRTADQKFASKK